MRLLLLAAVVLLTGCEVRRYRGIPTAPDTVTVRDTVPCWPPGHCPDAKPKAEPARPPVSQAVLWIDGAEVRARFYDLSQLYGPLKFYVAASPPAAGCATCPDGVPPEYVVPPEMVTQAWRRGGRYLEVRFPVSAVGGLEQFQFVATSVLATEERFFHAGATADAPKWSNAVVAAPVGEFYALAYTGWHGDARVAVLPVDPAVPFAQLEANEAVGPWGRISHSVVYSISAGGVSGHAYVYPIPGEAYGWLLLAPGDTLTFDEDICVGLGAANYAEAVGVAITIDSPKGSAAREEFLAGISDPATRRAVFWALADGAQRVSVPIGSGREHVSGRVGRYEWESGILEPGTGTGLRIRWGKRTLTVAYGRVG